MNVERGQGWSIRLSEPKPCNGLTLKSAADACGFRLWSIAARPLCFDDLEKQPDGIFFFSKRMNHGLARSAYSTPSPDQAGLSKQRFGGSFDVELVGLSEHAEKIVERKENVQRQF